MDHEKYCKIDPDGYYTVHFRNNSRLSFRNIENIFSKFGKVVEVGGHPKQKLRYVSYKTMDEIKNCVEGLKNNPEIVLSLEGEEYITTDQDSNQKQDKDSIEEESNEHFIHNKKSPETRFCKKKLYSTSIYNSKIFNGFDNVESDTDSQKISLGCKSNVNEVEACSENMQNIVISEEKHSLLQKQNSNGNSPIDKTNYELYYKILKDGSYTVHFANNKDFSEEMVTNMFSQYGRVLSVKAGKNLNAVGKSLMFIRFETLDDTISCLKAFQVNKLINILPQKDKLQADQKDLNQRHLLEDLPQKMTNEKWLNPTSDETLLETERKRTNDANDIKTSGWRHRSNDSADIDCQNFSRNYKTDTIKYDKPGSLINEITKINGNTHVNKNMFDDERTSRTLNFDTGTMKEEFNASAVSSGLSLEVASFNERILAEEVIVANIPDNFNVHNVCHLFKDYNPIKATCIKEILPTEDVKIRYCRIYFRTQEDAIAVERKFDRYPLDKERLIVLRNSSLIKEAMNV